MILIKQKRLKDEFNRLLFLAVRVGAGIALGRISLQFMHNRFGICHTKFEIQKRNIDPISAWEAAKATTEEFMNP